MRFAFVLIVLVFAGCSTAPKPRIVLRAQAVQPDAVNNPRNIATISTFELEW
jgi:hypothetical protein